MKENAMPQAKCGTVVACLFILTAGQLFLLRGTLAAGPWAWPGALVGELIFCVPMLAALVWCWGHPKGWTSNLGCAAAFVFFGAYLIFQIVFRQTFAQLYLSAVDTQFPSVGLALVAVKAVLLLMAVIAGIPAAPAPTGREYADKLRQAVHKQEAQWAKGSAAGAKQDLDAAMAKLRENLSPEELNALLSQLRDAPDQTPPGEDATAAEDWHGWGGGV